MIELKNRAAWYTYNQLKKRHPRVFVCLEVDKGLNVGHTKQTICENDTTSFQHWLYGEIVHKHCWKDDSDKKCAKCVS